MSLDLNPYLILLVFVVFLALILFLNIFLYRPILGFMQKREQFLQNGLSSLAEGENRIKENEVEIERILECAKNEANQIRDVAIKEAQKKYDEGLKSARLGLEEKFRENQENLSRQFQTIRQSLEDQSLDFVNLIQKKILGSAK